MTRTPEQRARLQTVIEWLAAGGPHTPINEHHNLTGFEFGTWASRNSCGTTGCIAGALIQFEYASLGIHQKNPDGHTIFQLDDDRQLNTRGLFFGNEAAQLAGLSLIESELLFTPFDMENEDLPSHLQDESLHYGDRTLDWTRDLAPEQIAVVLQHFQDTDDIDWELAR